ncbi:hypothetical protein QQS21_003604 [Conoideocrella luteorostrata]|uniref:FAD dependent oxidoreductase domain-containing protein n=1 Tax=Conoideocrella luteorostrata TaxID=1105319 RepID=A0AAJ0CTW7_9HYPO|nr:hypothetical protein QQS21_003604 [Conoideocrella luteorostrata]
MNFLPVPKATSPYWLSEPHPLASFRSSETVPQEVDIAIIGTGLSGVATAYHIFKRYGAGRKPSVTLLEARDACSGATGRNGGHVKTRLISLKAFYERHGTEAVAQLVALTTAQRGAIQSIVENENIECEFLIRRSFDMYFDKEHARELKAWLAERQEEGVSWLDDLQWLEGPHLDRITGVKGAVAAFGSSAISLWPYKFVTGLLERVVEQGATLYTNTPVYSVKSGAEEGPVMLSTSRGTVKAHKVVYATNAYIAGLLPKYRDVIVPFLGQNSRVVPNEATLRRCPNPAATYNLHHTSEAVDYLNPRPDGAIIHGGGSRNFRHGAADRSDKWFNTVDDSQLISDKIAPDFETINRERFYGWEESEAKVDSTWTGVMGVTPDGLPHAGRVPGTQNQWLLAGFNGGGMLVITTLSKGIADMVVDGKELEQTSVPSIFKSTDERLDNLHPEPSI